MFAIVITEKGGKKQRLEFDEESITIGRVQGNQVVLTRGNVSKEHCRISFRAGEFSIEDLGSTNGTYVNGRRIPGLTVVGPQDKIYVGEFILGVETGTNEESATAVRPPAPPLPVPPLPRIKVQPPAPAAHAAPAAMMPTASIPGAASAVPVPAAAPVSARTAGAVKSGHHTHLLDYAAIEIKRIDRAHLPCNLDEGTAGRLRIVLRELINDLKVRGKLSADDRPDTLLWEAFLAIADLGPLNHWLSDPSVFEIRLPGNGSARLRRSTGWSVAPESILPDALTAALQCLGAALPGTEENGIPGLVRYRTESGALVVVQFPPVSAQTSAVIYKNLACEQTDDTGTVSTLPRAALSALTAAVSEQKRIAVIGASAPWRLSIMTELTALLPADALVVTVEDLPLLCGSGSGFLRLAAGSADRTAVRTDSLPSLLTRAADLSPDWIVTRSVRWGDVPELLALAASRPGVIAELPAGGFQSLDQELIAGLLVSGSVLSAENAANLLAASFDMVILAGTSASGRPIIQKILRSAVSEGTWKPAAVFSV